MADVTTLWESQLFDEAVNGPWTDGTIAISPVINNQNQAYNAVDIVIRYETFTPDGKDVVVGSVITAVLEDEVAPGKWIAVSSQGRAVKGTDNALEQVIRFGPQTIVDYTPIAVDEGSKIRGYIQNASGVLGNNMRVRIVRVDNGGSPLHSQVRLSGYAREYDMP